MDFNPLPWQLISCQLIDAAYVEFGLDPLNKRLNHRCWLASSFEPEAVRSGVGLFAERWERGQYRGANAYRRLDGFIISAQDAINLERNERWLLAFAEKEQRAWIQALVELSANHEAFRRSMNALWDCPGERRL